MTYPVYETLDCSSNRKVFIVGDLHGEFRKLDQKLIDVGFQEETDILVSVGDLVDRGPYSEEFEDYIAKPWFRRALGDHELQPREYLLGYESAQSVSDNGGDWFLSKPTNEQERIAALLEKAPLALSIITPGLNIVGVTHADLKGHWDTMKIDLQDPELERSMVNMLVGSRDVIKYIRSVDAVDLNPEAVHVRGIDHVFHGHTPVDEILTVANRSWIDTDKGSSGGVLSVIDIDDWLQ